MMMLELGVQAQIDRGAHTPIQFKAQAIKSPNRYLSILTLKSY